MTGRDGFASDGAPLPPFTPAPPPLGPAETGRLTERVTLAVNSKMARMSNFEGARGQSARATLVIKWLSYFMLVLAGCGVTEYLTSGVTYAAHGGVFMLVAVTVVAVVGAGSTLFYVNLRTELVEKVRHYVFGIMVVPGLVVAVVVRLFQEWEWVNTGSVGSTLQIALPMVFLATVVIPMFIFVKEILGIRTIYRSKLDDQEAVALWTRMDGLQR